MAAYLDAGVLYALMKERDFNKPYAEKIASLKTKKCTSAVTLLELEIVIKREISNSLSLGVSKWARRAVPGLKIIPLTSGQFEKSLHLRLDYGLGIFDAVHAAAALDAGGEIASTDRVFDRIPGLKRIA